MSNMEEQAKITQKRITNDLFPKLVRERNLPIKEGFPRWEPNKELNENWRYCLRFDLKETDGEKFIIFTRKQLADAANDNRPWLTIQEIIERKLKTLS
jgi:hypothetical protein